MNTLALLFSLILSYRFKSFESDMGINGLLQYLKPVQKDRNISQYANQTVAIDSYCW